MKVITKEKQKNIIDYSTEVFNIANKNIEDHEQFCILLKLLLNILRITCDKHYAYDFKEKLKHKGYIK